MITALAEYFNGSRDRYVTQGEFMTSEEIQAQIGDDGNIHPAHDRYWLAEIAYQLAVLNERQGQRSRVPEAKAETSTPFEECS